MYMFRTRVISFRNLFPALPVGSLKTVCDILLMTPWAFSSSFAAIFPLGTGNVCNPSDSLTWDNTHDACSAGVIVWFPEIASSLIICVVPVWPRISASVIVLGAWFESFSVSPAIVWVSVEGLRVDMSCGVCVSSANVSVSTSFRCNFVMCCVSPVLALFRTESGGNFCVSLSFRLIWLINWDRPEEWLFSSSSCTREGRLQRSQT